MELNGFSDWVMLGVYLRVPSSKLDAIEAQHRSIDCCKKELFHAWLQINPGASWKDLVDALTLMEENTLATKLKSKYLVIHGEQGTIISLYYTYYYSK